MNKVSFLSPIKDEGKKLENTYIFSLTPIDTWCDPNVIMYLKR